MSKKCIQLFLDGVYYQTNTKNILATPPYLVGVLVKVKGRFDQNWQKSLDRPLVSTYHHHWWFFFKTRSARSVHGYYWPILFTFLGCCRLVLLFIDFSTSLFHFPSQTCQNGIHRWNGGLVTHQCILSLLVEIFQNQKLSGGSKSYY